MPDLQLGPTLLTPNSAKRPNRAWMTWGLALAVMLYGAAAMSFDGTFGLLAFAFVLLMFALNAARFFPPRETPARRRLQLLLVLALPLAAATISGPMGLVGKPADPIDAARLVLFQNACLAAAVILPIPLLFIMAGGRWFTVVVAALGMIVTFFVVAANLLAIAPGS